MTVLLLRFSAPMQSWGDSSRFARRATRAEPTKSGVLGLIAAAQGRRRTDPVEDLTALRLGTRTEQPGRLERDFQTAWITSGGSGVTKLSQRYYLHDAVFLAAVEADATLLDGIVDSIRNPVFPLYLGRRACPPAGEVVLGIRDGSVEDALRTEPWRASMLQMRARRDSRVSLPAMWDAEAGVAETASVRDVPLSFAPERREYGWRAVSRSFVEVENPTVPPGAAQPGKATPHDPFDELDDL